MPLGNRGCARRRTAERDSMALEDCNCQRYRVPRYGTGTLGRTTTLLTQRPPHYHYHYHYQRHHYYDYCHSTTSLLRRRLGLAIC